LAGQKGQSFDAGGELAAQGTIVWSLLHDLDQVPFYRKKFPKSLGREDVDAEIIPLIESHEISVVDGLATFCEHIAQQISGSVNTKKQSRKLLVTGGGALNNFLIDRIAFHSKAEVIIPERKIVEFKEAIIFAFLGVLRVRGEANCLKSVTGAVEDSCGGALYGVIK
jgi:anhydro-N-acetylmuramic acid kinase